MLSEETLNALHLVSWNINHRVEPWHLLPDADFDVALLQEAGAPPEEVKEAVEVASRPLGDGRGRVLSARGGRRSSGSPTVSV